MWSPWRAARLVPTSIALGVALAACSGGEATPTPQVGCRIAEQCPGTDGTCSWRTCSDGVCGFAYAPPGTSAAGGLSGDCRRPECDGQGNVVEVVDDSDPPIDGTACTLDLCDAGAPSNPVLPAYAPCAEAGGRVCDGAGACRECLAGADCASGRCVGGACAPPAMLSLVPADGQVHVSSSTGFSLRSVVPMDSGSFAVQCSPGPCTGTVRFSADGFATCAGLCGGSLWSGGGTEVQVGSSSFTRLELGATYEILVTEGLRAADGSSLGPHSSSFTVAPDPQGCEAPSPLVVSQVYAVGGEPGATFRSDFVEIHNRSATPRSLDGWSIQTAAHAAPTTYAVAPIAGTVPPGGFFLVELAPGAEGAALPAPDATSGVSLANDGATVALVPSSTPLTGSCGSGGGAADVVHWFTAAGPMCNETLRSDAPVASRALRRRLAGCQDSDLVSSDFDLGAPAPRSSATPPALCPCANGPVNESDAAVEADHCSLVGPATWFAAPGETRLVSGRVREVGVTDLPGAAAPVVAQLGIGTAGTDPRSAQGWVFRPAFWERDDGGADVYRAKLAAPATAGSYAWAFRVSLDGGARWTYSDLDGAGSDAGLAFDPAGLGALTVSP